MDAAPVARLPDWIVGHRGAKDVQPENSLEGFGWAIANGVTAVEFDVRLTRDEQLVCVHDETLQAYGGPSTRIDQMAAADVTAVTLAAGVTVPLLTQVLDLAAGTLSLNIEIKNHEGEASFSADRRASELLAALLDQRHDAGVDDRIVAVSSFDHDSVTRFGECLQRASAPGALLTRPGSDVESIAAAAQARDVAAVHPHHTSLLRAKSVRYLLERGLTVRTWTVNNAFLARRLVVAGVSGVVTDDPRRLV